MRTISGGSAVGVAVQALSTGKLSARININASLEVRQAVSVVDRILGNAAITTLATLRQEAIQR